MFPKRVDVKGNHTVVSAAANPEELGRSFARVWFRSYAFFGLMAVMGAADLLIGISSEAYLAAMALLIFPLAPTVAT